MSNLLTNEFNMKSIMTQDGWMDGKSGSKWIGVRMETWLVYKDCLEGWTIAHLVECLCSVCEAGI